jgi:hypothetical protein
LSVALLVDTVQVLKRQASMRLAPSSRPQRPIRLVLASHSAGGHHFGLRQWTHFWHPTCVELMPVRAVPDPSVMSKLSQLTATPGRPPSDHISFDPYAAHGAPAGSPAIPSVRHWTARLHHPPLMQTKERYHPTSSTHHYSILASENGDQRILWMVSETTGSDNE